MPTNPRFHFTRFFLAETSMRPAGDFPPVILTSTKRLLRYSAVASATVIAILLHVAVFFWYFTRPTPPPFSAAAPLPMIAMVLSAPPAPNQAVVQPVVPPQSVQPKVTQKPQPKPAKKPKPKPKPVHRDAVVKQVEKAQEEPESAPKQIPAPAAPVVTHNAPAAAPRNERYTPSSSNANYLNNPIPDYPLTARQNHWQGRVLLRVYISASGQCEKLFVQRSSGHEELDDSALAAVKNWRFVPAKRGDTPEASWATVPIDFELD